MKQQLDAANKKMSNSRSSSKAAPKKGTQINYEQNLRIVFP